MFSAFKKKDPGKKHNGSPVSEYITVDPQILFPVPQSPPPCDLLDKAWRTLDWTKRNDMKEKLRGFQISTPETGKLRILVHGLAGAGKSSFINSIDSIFQERITTGALAEAATGRSFTKTLQTHLIKDQKYGSFLPFALCDIMGLEGGQDEGVETEDLISVLNGHIKDGYTFNPAKACSANDPGYNRNPELSNRIHCLVSIFPANNISLAGKDIFNKMREVRAKAGGIPQVAVLTKVDDACPKVAEDLKQVYKSKRIKEKMQEYSNRLGVPMNCIFPVKNYHEEIQLNNNEDVLLLSALNFILNAANDHVAVMATAPPGVTGTLPSGPPEMVKRADSTGIYERVIDLVHEDDYTNKKARPSPPPSPPPSHTPPSPSTTVRRSALPPRRVKSEDNSLSCPPSSALTIGEEPALRPRRGSLVPSDPSGPPSSALTTGEKPALPPRRGSLVPSDPSGPLSSALTIGEKPALPPRRGSLVPPDPSDPLSCLPSSALTIGEKPALPPKRGSLVPPDPSEPPVTPLSPSSSTPPSFYYNTKKPLFLPPRVNMADKHLPFKYADMDSCMKTH